MTAPIIERIRTAENLPSPPAVAMEVLKMMRRDDVSLVEIARLIEQDPALTAKLLRTANSSLFGLPRHVSSVQRAMVALGLRTVRVIVLSFSLVEAIRDNDRADFDYEAFWRRSLSTAVGARLLARHLVPERVEEAFVSGLLADLGIVAAWRCARDLYQPVLVEWRRGRRRLDEIEAGRLGVTHAQMSVELLRAWCLPEILCVAVCAHHGEGLDRLAGEGHELARVVRSAASVAGLICGETSSGELEGIKAQCRADVGIDDATLDQVLHDISGRVQEAAALFSVSVKETIDYAQLQAQAAQQLAQLSVQAEFERAEHRQREEAARVEVDRLRAENKSILEIASTDSLTRLANRATFDKRLVEQIDQACAEGVPVSLIMLDIDYFKQVNDTFGHQAGDEVLRDVAACMNDVIRRLGFVARYGGEEFAAIIARQSAATIRELAEQIRRTIESRVVCRGEGRLRVTASLGTAWADPHTTPIDAEALVAQADRCLYQAKRHGRNRVETAAPDGPDDAHDGGGR